MSIKTRPNPRFVYVVAGFLALLVGCGGDGGATPSSTSTLPPAPAPQSLTPTTFGGQASGPSVSGTPVMVVNEDPAGSGAYKFNPAVLTFKRGDVAAFTLTAETEFHTFTVEELGIDESLDKGERLEFSYTFDKSGTFQLVCLVHIGQGMVGTVTVN